MNSNKVKTVVFDIYECSPQTAPLLSVLCSQLLVGSHSRRTGSHLKFNLHAGIMLFLLLWQDIQGSQHDCSHIGDTNWVKSLWLCCCSFFSLQNLAYLPKCNPRSQWWLPSSITRYFGVPRTTSPKYVCQPGFTPSMQSRVSMMAAISSMSITPLLSMSYNRNAHFNLSSSAAQKD